MKKGHLATVHIAYWLYVFVVFEMMNKLAYQGKFISLQSLFGPMSLSNYILFTLIFYLNYLLVLPALFSRKKYLLTVLSWAGLVALFIALRYLVQEHLFKKYLGICNYCIDNNKIYITNNFFQGFSSLILAGTVIWFIDNWLHVKKQEFMLRQEKLAAEKAFLQSQVSPHFLFNTLNNIYSMVFHRSDNALQAIQKLADIMRYATQESRHDGVELATEIMYLRNYIELQRYRVRNPAIDYTEAADGATKTIAPMLLVSFVENAFKHGIFNDAAHPLAIHLQASNEELSLHVRNKVNHNRTDPSSGVGQNNVKKRLELYYPGRHELRIRHDENFYESKLILKL
ncbi:MAG TPA: histidine kinase [Chitinophagaceae bacterium]|nr:histidine kinase [Chitinophagaceae bacterium]